MSKFVEAFGLFESGYDIMRFSQWEDCRQKSVPIIPISCDLYSQLELKQRLRNSLSCESMKVPTPILEKGALMYIFFWGMIGVQETVLINYDVDDLTTLESVRAYKLSSY